MGHLQRVLSLFTASLALFAALSVPAARGADRPKTVILATTTSTQDSGLLDLLIPAFEKRSGYFVKTISVGSGQALALGERGEADVLLVHSPESERAFVAQGFGIDPRLVMHNDFLLLGPAGDPARIRGAGSAAKALQRIARTGSLFLSRGDNSGTHAKERGLWKTAGIVPDRERWYQQTGLGMGETLNVASEKRGYLLADRGTFLALDKKRGLGLEILLAGEPGLLNVYHVIRVNPARWPKVNGAGARAFADFMVAGPTQELIGSFGAREFGSPLFFPDAGKNPKSLGL